MLTITIKAVRSFHIGVASVHVVRVNGQQVRIGIEAPEWVKVWRDKRE